MRLAKNLIIAAMDLYNCRFIVLNTTFADCYNCCQKPGRSSSQDFLLHLLRRLRAYVVNSINEKAYSLWSTIFNSLSSSACWERSLIPLGGASQMSVSSVYLRYCMHQFGKKGEALLHLIRLCLRTFQVAKEFTVNVSSMSLIDVQVMNTLRRPSQVHFKRPLILLIVSILINVGHIVTILTSLVNAPDFVVLCVLSRFIKYMYMYKKCNLVSLPFSFCETQML